MIRVTHVITSLDVGGAQRMLVKLLERIDRARFESSVATLVGGGALTARVSETGAEVHDLRMRPRVPDPRGVLRLRRILRRERPHVVQTWLYHADLVGTLAAAGLGLPALAWNLRCTHHSGFVPRLCALLSRFPDLIVSNSEAGRTSHAAIGYRPRRWELVPNGFDLEAFAPDVSARSSLRAELGLEPDAVLAGVVARWHPMKNVEGVLDVAGRLAEELGELHFVLVGEGLSHAEPAFRAAYERHGSPGNVRALGPRADIPRLMAGFDFLLSVSTFYEGFPNVLGEALACGTPCVTTPIGDSAEVVGPAGSVLSGTDADALVDGVRAMACLSPGERQELGRLGRLRMKQRFDLDDVVQRYEALYNQLPGNESSRR